MKISNEVLSLEEVKASPPLVLFSHLTDGTGRTRLLAP